MKKYSTNNTYTADFNYCRQFLFSFGSNYALATRFFKKDIRKATIIFYAFLRYADELIDNPEKDIPGKTHDTIDEFVVEWEKYKKIKNQNELDTAHPIIRMTHMLFTEKNIPFDYLDDFLAAMMLDRHKERYANYIELESYMWGSASVVGYVMTHIVGYQNKTAFQHAKALGEAMQLTNFLRDVKEDYSDRNRIYLPQQDLFLFGVTEKMIADKKMTEELAHLIKFYVERSHSLYNQAWSGITLLNQGNLAVKLASRIYAYNLKILERRNYDIFRKPIRVSKMRKGIIVIQTIIDHLFKK